MSFMGVDATMSRVLCGIIALVVALVQCRESHVPNNVSLIEYNRVKRSPIMSPNWGRGWQWGNVFVHPNDRTNPFTPRSTNVYVVTPPPTYVIPQRPYAPNPNAALDPDTILFKLHISTVLRNNLVNVFGYLLYNPSVRMDLDLYASLMDIYQGIRSKRINTHELIYAIPNMAFKRPHDQLCDIFQILVYTRPLYLTGAVKVWKDALTTRAINLDNVLQPPNRGLQVDLLDNIEFKYLPHIKQVRFPPVVEQLAPKHLLANMGTFVGGVFGALLHGSLHLTRKIMAYIMFHTPLYMFIPEVDEAIHYLADVLIGYDSGYLDFACQNIDRVSLGDPHMLVTQFLTKIINAPNMDPNVKECAEIVLPHFLAINVLTLNPYYNTMLPIFAHRTLDIPLILSPICIGEYPDDIVKAKDMLVMAIQVPEIRISDVLLGFVKHEYVTPHQLMYALLERIRRRGNVPAYLVEPLRAIIIHVKLKYASINVMNMQFSTFNDFKMLLEAFFTTQMPSNYKKMITDLITCLKNVPINWKDVFLKFNSRENTRPRQFARQILLYLLSNGVIKDVELRYRLSDFVRATDTSGDPKDCPTVKCEGNNIQEPSTMATLPLPAITIATTTPVPVEENKKPDDIDIAQLFNSLMVDASDVPNLVTLQNYIKDTIGKFHVNLDVSKFPTSGELLKGIFHQYLNNDEVKRDQKMVNLIQQYLPKIQEKGLGARPVQYITKKIIRLVDINKALLALDENAINRDGKTRDLEALYTFLAGDYKLVNYLERFQYESFKTRGEFMEGFFERLVSFPNNPSESVKRSISALLPHVKKTGDGAAPLDYDESVYTSVETSDI